MRNRIVMLSLAVTMTFSLTACTVDLSPLLGQQEETEIAWVEAEVLLTENQKEIKRLEQVYASGQFEAADVMNLARLYKEEGFIKKSRDIYEVAYRIYEDEQALEELSKMTVNLLEEDEEIVEAVEVLVSNMKTPEYFGEALYSLFSDEWFDTMMPKMSVGQRSYYLEGVAEMLRLIVYYGEDGTKNAKVFLENNGELTVLSKDKSQLQVIQTGVDNDNYHGAFTAWTLSVETGEIIREEGTFAEGKYVGDYTISIHPGYGASDLLSLWNNREDMEMTTYYGNFGEDGVSTLEQQGDAAIIIYAYTEDGTGYLSIPAPVDENGSPIEATYYSFGASTFGMPEIPVVEKYDIAEEIQIMVMGEDNIPTIKPTEEPKVSLSEIQVRIFDGEVQIFDGTKWTSYGSVDKLVDEDIIAIMEAGNATVAPTTSPSQKADGASLGSDATASSSPTSGGSRGQGTVATPTPVPTATPKPTVKPTVAPTTAPTVAPTKAPSNSNDDDDDDHNSGSSGSSSQPSTPSTPSTPSEPEDSGSSGGGSDSGDSGDSSGGQDIEDGWSDIIQ